MSHEQLGHDNEAEQLYQQALEHQRRARSIQPEVVVHRVFYTNHLLGLGGVFVRAGRLDEAARLADEAASLWAREASPLVRSAILMVECVRAAGPVDLPEARARRDRFGQRAVSILNKAVDGGLRDTGFFHTSRQLDPIRDRDDFKALIAPRKDYHQVRKSNRYQIHSTCTGEKEHCMGNSFKLTSDRFPPASLGCGTLVIIAIIVWLVEQVTKKLRRT